MGRSERALVSGLFAGRYSVERVIGQGATATVHLARDLERGLPVAIKVLRPELAESSAIDRFLKEIRRTGSLHHPHILPVLDSGESGGLLYFVLPYMDGGTLRDLLKREKTLELTNVLAIARTIGDALDYAHQRGLIHRDVKPENILFNGGQACLGDFGIARALDLSGTDTSSTTVRGTPAYMSPEQAAGEELDARSDLYSFACVVYEMITGMQAFIGPSAQAVMFSRFVSTPRETRIYRPGTPPALDVVLAKAFSLTPADRFRTVREFVDGLEQAINTPRAEKPARLRAPRMRRLAGAAAGVAIPAIAAIVWAFIGGPTIEPARHIVVPFAAGRPGSSPILDGASIATLAYDALLRWPDLLRVDPLRVHDLVSRRGAYPASLADALALARAARAGKLIWGEAHERDGRTVIRAVLYDVTDPGATPREASVLLAAGGDDSLSVRFAALVDSLVTGGQPRPSPGSARPFAAVGAYTAGASALNGWDLRAAQRHFRAALEAEPEYPAASLRFAQVSQWLGDRTRDWRAAAASAAASWAELPQSDVLHARALLALADADYPTACTRYSELIGRDSVDFAAWFGLGECQLLDHRVVRDLSRSPQLRFRSSRHGAASAYMRAFEIVPSAYRAYREMIAARLDRAFITRSGHFRTGAIDGDSIVYAALPELSGDTIAFVPSPFDEYTTGNRAAPRSMNAALDRARRQIVDLSERWITVSTESPQAWEVRTLALENAGVIAGHRTRSALGSIASARARATTQRDSVRLAAIELRLRLKAGHYRSARHLADSLLARATDPDPTIAGLLGSVAGLRGRLADMDRLLERYAPLDSSFVGLNGQAVRPSPTLAALALRLLAHCALDGAVDSVTALEQRIESHLAAIPDDAQRATIREAVMRNAAMVAFSRLGVRPVHAERGQSYLVAQQAMLARGDSAPLREALGGVTRLRRAQGVPPGAVSVEAAYVEAWLLAQLGDSAGAVDRLDGLLDNLAAQGDLIGVFHRPVMLVSAMELRALIAERRGDVRGARRWRDAVGELRASADPDP